MNKLENRFLIFGAWCGIGLIVLMLGGLAVVAGFFPPHPPSANADTISEIYASNFYRIRVGLVLMMAASAATILFTSATTVLIAKIEGKQGFLSNTYLVSGFGLAVLIFYPAIWWLTAAFRPDRGAEFTYLLNDIGWLQFVGGLFIGWLMFPILTVAAFVESGERRYFSRWYGYLCAWTAVALMPGQLVFFLYEGPFAWSGLLAFYVPLTAFLIWTLATAYYMRKAGKQGL